MRLLPPLSTFQPSTSARLPACESAKLHDMLPTLSARMSVSTPGPPSSEGFMLVRVLLLSTRWSLPSFSLVNGWMVSSATSCSRDVSSYNRLVMTGLDGWGASGRAGASVVPVEPL